MNIFERMLSAGSRIVGFVSVLMEGHTLLVSVTCQFGCHGVIMYEFQSMSSSRTTTLLSDVDPMQS